MEAKIISKNFSFSVEILRVLLSELVMEKHDSKWQFIYWQFDYHAPLTEECKNFSCHPSHF